ncbi:MAG: hypothetical protein K9N46_10130 [Candidatus Marinimicrobia bacterium]|nr:hypothetical protein [Candidatus Neomarinimicrobiota bacterium]MCF7829265.1 hypothetical protein [Candidatus Neomarinimicrobiota bacterium]MCF7881082.1 hypothetical protein [Candidatus Neomarinimicrobiota bacterium]
MFQAILKIFSRPKVNEYGYNPHKKRKSFFRQDNPWLYVFVLVVGLTLSYALVSVSMM